MKSYLSFILRVLLSFSLLFWLFRKIDFPKMREILASADLPYFIYAFGVYWIIIVLLLVRWFVLIRALGVKVRIWDVTRFFFIGMFWNLFFPSAIGGDIIKAFGLCRNTDQKAKVVASVILDRLSGFASIVLVASVSFVFGYRILNDPSLLVLIALLAILSIAVFAVLFNEKLYSFGCRLFNKVPKIKNSLMNLHYDAVLIKDKRAPVVGVLVLSSLCQIILAIVFYLFAKALHQDIAFVYFLIFSPMVCVATSLPSIGGLGVREVGWVYLLGKIGIAEGISVGMSLMSFLYMVIVGLVGGVIYVCTLSTGRLQHYQSDAATGEGETARAA